MTEYHEKEHGVNPEEPSSLQDLIDKATRFENGDSFIMDGSGEHVIVCCDCGLTHKITIEEAGNDDLKVSTWRSPELSRAFRTDNRYHFPFNPLNKPAEEEVVDDRPDEITLGEDNDEERD